jgi:hypothetical protein
LSLSSAVLKKLHLMCLDATIQMVKVSVIMDQVVQQVPAVYVPGTYCRCAVCAYAAAHLLTSLSSTSFTAVAVTTPFTACRLCYTNHAVLT